MPRHAKKPTVSIPAIIPAKVGHHAGFTAVTRVPRDIIIIHVVFYQKIQNSPKSLYLVLIKWGS